MSVKTVKDGPDFEAAGPERHTQLVTAASWRTMKLLTRSFVLTLNTSPPHSSHSCIASHEKILLKPPPHDLTTPRGQIGSQWERGYQSRGFCSTNRSSGSSHVTCARYCISVGSCSLRWMTWEPDDGRYMLVEVLAVVAAVVLGRLSRRYPWLMDFWCRCKVPRSCLLIYPHSTQFYSIVLMTMPL